MKKIVVIYLVLISYCCLQNAFAQDICISKPLEVTTARGIVFFSNGTKIEDLPIKLSRGKSGKKYVAETRTDKQGMFSFDNIKSGTYYLIVEFEDLVSLTTRLRVKKKSVENSQIGIKITMFPLIPGNCSIAETYCIPNIEE